MRSVANRACAGGAARRRPGSLSRDARRRCSPAAAGATAGRRRKRARQVLVAKRRYRHRRAAVAPTTSSWQDWPQGRRARRLHHRRARRPRRIDRHEGHGRPLRALPGRADPPAQARPLRPGLSVGGARQGHARRVDLGRRRLRLGRLHRPQRPCRRDPDARNGRAGRRPRPSSPMSACSRSTRGSARPARPARRHDPERSASAEIFANTAIATLELDPVAGRDRDQCRPARQAVAGAALDRRFRAATPTTDQLQRNAPIKIIRYGHEANVMAGTAVGGNRRRRSRSIRPASRPPSRSPSAPALASTPQ